MSRNIVKRTTTGLAAAATTGALILAVPGVAQAREFDRGNDDRERSARDGSGDAEARARANNDGRLRVFTEADGGNEAGTPLPGGDSSTPTRADATASLMRRVAVAEGTYKVVVRYKGLSGFDRERGNDSNAEVKRRSVVRFEAQAGGGDRRVRRIQQVPDKKSNRRTRLLIEVPNDSSGFLKVSADLDAKARADGNRNFGKAGARVRDIVFKVNRVR